MKKRKTLTEPEVRFFLAQMVPILIKLKEANIIHREYFILNTASNQQTTFSAKILLSNWETSDWQLSTMNNSERKEAFVEHQITLLLK